MVDSQSCTYIAETERFDGRVLSGNTTWLVRNTLFLKELTERTVIR
jgi:hypothetical protein